MSQDRSYGQELPKRKSPVDRRARLLATEPSPIPTKNRFDVLLQEEVPTELPDQPEPEALADRMQEPTPMPAEIGNIEKSMEHDLLCFKGRINGHEAMILLDSGSTHDFISEDFVNRHGIPCESVDSDFHVCLANGTTSVQPMRTTGTVKLTISKVGEYQTLTVFPLSRYDVILGKPWLTKNNPNIDFKTNTINVSSTGEAISASQNSVSTESGAENMFISGRQARRALRGGAEGILAYVSKVEQPQPSQPVSEVMGEQRQELEALLEQNRDFLPDKLPEKLPPERFIDHEIDLTPGAPPPSRSAYRLPKPEMDELQTQLTMLLERGFIEPSKSPYGAPVFFVKKADGTLRMVCDWRELNRITIKNKACLPNVDDLFDTIQGSMYFSKLDLHSGYNQVRIKESDIPKTAINTPFGHFQFRVMGFGLTNAPATFQTMMNDILRPYLRKFVVVFLDYILIFSKSWEEHLEHVRTVLEILKANQLYCKPSKCKFGATEIGFLGHRITGTTLAPDPEKIKAVEDWPLPKSVSDVRKFLGFANYFRRFINHYSVISQSLEEITGKNARFSWNAARQHAFQQLKTALLEAPVLQLANIDLPFRVDTDASDCAVAGVLLQRPDNDSEWHPVSYASRKLTPAERNYTAAERETLAVVFALQEWRMYLFKHFDLYTDNMDVIYLRTKPCITKREARWVEFLADYDFTTHHRSGDSNVADPLSRRPDYQLNGLEFSLEVQPEVSQLICKEYDKDSELLPIIKRLKASSEDAIHKRYTWNENTQRLYLISSGQSRLCIPQGSLRLQLLQENHDCAIAGHQGRYRTYLKLSRHFYWPGMGKSVQKFVKSCDRCQRVKGSQLKSGLLQSLPVPDRPWSDISMDFIMGLPLTTRGHSAIYTFVDRLTKQVHLIPTSCHVDARETARLYIDHVFVHHGLSKTIVCDRDPRFTSTFFQEVFAILGTDIKMSTANHPQTNGMTERVNRVVEDTLRAFVNHHQDNWDQLLPLCEFAINDSCQASTGETPFFLNHGQHPLTPSSIINNAAGRRDHPWLSSRLDVLKIAQDALVTAQARQALYADRGRFPDDIKQGDDVLVHRDFLLTS